jgi:serine/threonine protein kinase/tetratricopeptide (TPR) repeat protein
VDTDRYQRIKKIFDAALERDPSERSAFLDEACEAELRAEVEELLDIDSGAGDFLKPSTLTPIPAPARRGDLIGQRIGQYIIQRIISSGGMGTVYEAAQEQPRRTVALKVLKEGMATASALRRFEYEAEILARLRHPGIAQVIEAGTHDDVPFFVMEFVEEAKSITEYADDERLDVRGRLGLFNQLLSAIGHGHQKGIIHRDLKPSNILVNGEGQVKVIDFGVARATDADVTMTTMHTAVGQLIGTLQYMSPEQCKADPADLDVRSDVYGLGVVLYELLCGELPYDIRQTPFIEAARAIREEEPKRPSTTNRMLRGDLETILLKALEKDRGRRYQSVAELSEDLRRYLSGEVILARPAGAATRFYKRVKRNPVLSASVGMALVALAGFFIYVLFYSYPRIMAERDKAQGEAEKVRIINDYLVAMLTSPDPNIEGREVRVVDVLDDAVEQIPEKLGGQPEIEATLRCAIAKTYWSLAQYRSMEEQFRLAYGIEAELYGEESPETLNTLTSLIIAIQSQGRYEEAGVLYEKLLDAYLRTLGEEDEATLLAMGNHAGLALDRGDFDKAEAILRRILEIRQRISRGETLALVDSRNAYATCLFYQEKFAEAEPLIRKVLEARRRLLGDVHTDTVATMNALGMVLLERGKTSEAESLLREAVDVQTKLTGEDHPDWVYMVNNLGGLLFDQGREEEGLALKRKALEKIRSIQGDDHPSTLRFLDSVGENLCRLRRLEEAHRLLEECVSTGERVLPDDYGDLGWYYFHFGQCLYLEDRHGEAEAYLKKSFAWFNRLKGEGHQDTRTVAEMLFILYDARGMPGEAEAWKKMSGK